MTGRLFGKRTNGPKTATPSDPPLPKNDGSDWAGGSDGGSGGGGSGSGGDGNEFPWDGQPDYAACNFALGHLIQNLPERLKVEGRIHAETFLTAGAVIAGFAAQRALLARLAETGDADLQNQIHIVTTENGSKFVFGEPLNQMLLPQSDEDARAKLWSLAAGAAVDAGLAMTDLPKLEDMFASVTSRIGGEQEGMPSVAEEHQPHLPPRDLLKAVWPLATMCFSGRFPGASREYGEARTRFWPAIGARAAHAFIGQVKDVLDPHTALTIVMETAIYASKLDPAVVEGSDAQ